MALNSDEKSALRSFKTHLEETLGNRLVDLKLFGSKARGDDRLCSDLDVLAVVADENWQVCDTVYGIATEALLETGICISPKVISQRRFEQLSKEDNSFMRNVRRDAVAV
jgi:predicted nucleotidyltransferase